ncbi:MAG: 3-dehydroquinate synthase [Chloroflexia bacterium]
MHPVATGEDVLHTLPELLAEFGLGGTAFIITDEHLLPIYAGPVRESLERSGWKVGLYAVPPGEESKSLERAATRWDWLASERAERRHVVIALGGGVVGDLAGWVAATYLRGLPLVQVPTTLLAQVDSSIGGKTGVNHRSAKNLIGSFYPPVVAIIDPALLRTLPERELRCGWAEVVKTALIADPALFEFLLARRDDLLALDPAALAHVVGRCAEIKLQVVTEDPTEQGRRAILNYGHTLGHGIENAAGYGALTHGEAIAIGMRAAARIAVELGLLDPAVAARQYEALDGFGLPASAPGLSVDAVLAAMRLDKKVHSGTPRWVLLEGVGRPIVRSDVPEDLVRLAAAECVR